MQYSSIDLVSLYRNSLYLSECDVLLKRINSIKKGYCSVNIREPPKTGFGVEQLFVCHRFDFGHFKWGGMRFGPNVHPRRVQVDGGQLGRESGLGARVLRL